MKQFCGFILPGLLLVSPLAAQDVRIASRFDARAASVIEQVIADATARGVPAEPLVQKALEGAAMGASAVAIESALKAFAQRLEAVRLQLGAGATEAELVAGSSALFVGTPPEALARLRAIRPDRSLAMPLLALTFFVQRGVDTRASLAWIESLVAADVRRDELLRLQQSIEADMRAGAAPAAASATRVEALLRAHNVIR
jgi:hypothetical protein